MDKLQSLFGRGREKPPVKETTRTKSQLISFIADFNKDAFREFFSKDPNALQQCISWTSDLLDELAYMDEKDTRALGRELPNWITARDFILQAIVNPNGNPITSDLSTLPQGGIKEQVFNPTCVDGLYIRKQVWQPGGVSDERGPITFYHLVGKNHLPPTAAPASTSLP